MPLVGFTTESVPDRVFTPSEMLAWLASDENVSDITYAMGYSMLQGLRGDTVLSATGFTGICPREHYFRRTEDYTVELEKQFYAMMGTSFHTMVEAAPYPLGFKALREKRFAKRLAMPDGTTVLLPARPDEVILNWRNGKALVRDYKTTKAVPKYNNPYKLHTRQLSIYRLVLSDYPEPPLVLPEGVEYWALGAEAMWEPTDPIDIEYGEIVYFDKERSKRLLLEPGVKGRSFLEDPETIYDWLIEQLQVYQGTPGLTYLEATSPPYSFEWKCQDWCPVRNQCWKHHLTYETSAQTSEAP